MSCSKDSTPSHSTSSFNSHSPSFYSLFCEVPWTLGEVIPRSYCDPALWTVTYFQHLTRFESLLLPTAWKRFLWPRHALVYGFKHTCSEKSLSTCPFEFLAFDAGAGDLNLGAHVFTANSAISHNYHCHSLEWNPSLLTSQLYTSRKILHFPICQVRVIA